jgi:hypothetical protein
VWFLVTRFIAIGSTHLGAALMNEQKRDDWRWVTGKSDLFPGTAPAAFLAATVRWDANYYLTLSRTGYPPRGRVPVFHMAFFPLYPLVVRGFALLVGDTFWAAFFVSNLCALLAAFVTMRLGAIGRRPRDGLRAAMFLLASPGAHFFSYAYPEALFVLLLSLAFLAIAIDRPLLAIGPGALASATRSAGVVVSLVLLLLAWQRRHDARAAAIRIFSAVAALGGLAAFAFFCRIHFQDALAFAHIQGHFGRSITLFGPLRALVRFTVDPDYFVVTLGALALCVWMAVRTPGWMTAAGWFLLLLPMSTGTLKAMIRYQATNLPLIAGAARVWRDRRYGVLLYGCLSLMAFEAFLFGKGIGHY